METPWCSALTRPRTKSRCAGPEGHSWARLTTGCQLLAKARALPTTAFQQYQGWQMSLATAHCWSRPTRGRVVTAGKCLFTACPCHFTRRLLCHCLPMPLTATHLVNAPSAGVDAALLARFTEISKCWSLPITSHYWPYRLASTSMQVASTSTTDHFSLLALPSCFYFDAGGFNIQHDVHNRR